MTNISFGATCISRSVFSLSLSASHKLSILKTQEH